MCSIGDYVSYKGHSAIIIDKGTYFDMECKYLEEQTFDCARDESVYKAFTENIDCVVLSTCSSIELCVNPSDISVIEM